VQGLSLGVQGLSLPGAQTDRSDCICRPVGVAVPGKPRGKPAAARAGSVPSGTSGTVPSGTLMHTMPPRIFCYSSRFAVTAGFSTPSNLRLAIVHECRLDTFEA